MMWPCVSRVSLKLSLLAYFSVVGIDCNPNVRSIFHFRSSLARTARNPRGLRIPTTQWTTIIREEQRRAFRPGGAWGSPRALPQEDGETLVDVKNTGTKSKSEANSTMCESKCDQAGTLTLTKELLPELLQEVARYLGVAHFLIFTHHNNQGLCMAAARSLYLRGVSTSCTSRVTITCCHSAVVVLAHQQDAGGDVSEQVQQVSQAVSEGRVVTPHLVVVLQAHTRLLLPLSHRLRLCVLQPKGDAVEFREVFTFGSGPAGRPVQDVVGRWRPGFPSRLQERSNVIGPRDFLGNTIRFAVFQLPPYVILEKEANGTLRLSGILVDFIFILQQQLNFTIQWVESLDMEFGVPTVNNSWTGLVGELQRQTADAALIPLSRTISRSKVIDFSPPIDYTKSRILTYNNGDQLFMDWNTYVVGFHWSVWATMVGMWVVMSVGIVKVAKRMVQVSLYDYLFSFAGAYAQQGCEVVPECLRGRLVFLTFWMGAVLLYHSYTARLTSHLAVVYTLQPFASLTDALTRAGYSIAAQKGTSYVTAMESSQDQAMQLLYSQLMAKPSLFVSNNHEGLSLLQDTRQKIAFFQESNSANYEIRGNCSYMWVGPEYFKEYMHLGYQKNLSFAGVLSSYIVQARETGVLKKLIKKWWGKQIRCSSTASFPQLDFSKTISAFVLLGVGAAVSVIILFAELSLCYFRPCRTLQRLFEGECLAAKRRKHLRKVCER